MKKRIAALLLALLLMAQMMPISAAQPEEGGGRFAFAACTASSVVIRPTFVSYGDGQTVLEALRAAGYRLEGPTDAYINVIEGVEAGYSRYANDGNYDMERPASEITAFVFVGGTVELAMEQLEDYCGMVTAMAEYNTAGNGVENYSAAAAAYDRANSALFQTKADHAALAAGLRSAAEEYVSTILNGAQVPVVLRFETTEGAALTDYTFTVRDVYSSRSFGPADSLALRAGTYDFRLSAGGCAAYGSMTVQEDGTVLIGGAPCETICLAQTPWIGEIVLRAAAGADSQPYPAENDTYWIPDSTNAAYIRITKTDAAPSDAAPAVSYVKASGEAVNSLSKPWNSNAASLAGVLDKNGLGNSVTVEARSAFGGYTLLQTREITLRRTPTLAALHVSANGIAQEFGFAPLTESYSLTVESDTLVLSAQALDEGACVTVNGEVLAAGAQREIALLDGTTDITIAVTTAAAERVYTLQATKVDAETVTLSHDGDVSVRVFNAAGAEIGAAQTGETADRFALVPGQTYHYVADKNTYYHTTESFTASAGLTVEVKTPHTADTLTKLELRSGSGVKTPAYLEAAAFAAENHSYGIQMADPYSKVYLWANSTGGSIRALGPQSTVTITPGKATGQPMLLPSSDQRLTITVQAAEADSTYYQEYFITIDRILTLSDLRAVVDGEAANLYQVADGSVTARAGFDEEIPEYQVNIIRACNEAVLTVVPFGQSYYLLVNGERCDLPVNGDGTAAQAVELRLPLDHSLDRETVDIAVCSDAEGAIFQTYRVSFCKNDAVATALVCTNDGEVIPDALVVVIDNMSGDRVWPEADGSFPLVETMEYSYTATCYGYVGVQGSLTAAKDSARVEIPMTATATGGIETTISSSWPYFRGTADANGVVNVRTPIQAEETMLSWANKLGDGYSSAAVSCPILITENGYDYLIVYAGDRIFKVDALSGTVVATGTMDRSSSFAINSPTYAEGMIFVGLSNGGVQAFRADTLESVWLYNDARGGQPNCPIAYYDGYVYTGFWNSETTAANFVCLSVTDEDPTQGKEVKLPTWTHTDKGFYWAGCYVSDDFLLVGTDDGDSGYVMYSSALLCLDPRTGAVLDSIQGLRGDIRSNVSYDSASDRYYFTSKGGYFYSVKVDCSSGSPRLTGLKQVYLYNYADDLSNPPMSTCTPVIYNGRAYIGVSGVGQFVAYSGHNITVIDLNSWSVAYSVRTQGYPQTSGLLTTGYDDAVYVYFFDNFTPGKLRVLKDRPGQTKPELVTMETYTDKGTEYTYETPYVLFTPTGNEAQYAICSPITDTANGTIYFKNDSARLMALSSTIERMEVTKLPDKTEYEQGETFDPTGMEITVTYTNGTSRTLPVSRTVNGVQIDYFRWSDQPLQADMPDLMISYVNVMYQNVGEDIGVPYTAPQAVLTLEIHAPEYVTGDVNADGSIDAMDLALMQNALLGRTVLTDGEAAAADLDGNGDVDAMDLAYLQNYLLGRIQQFPVNEQAISGSELP